MKEDIRIHKIEEGLSWKGNPERAYSKKDGLIMHGHYKHYKKGSLNAVGTWIDGLKEGAWQYFYQNGELFSRGYYKNNERFPNKKSWDYFKESGEKFKDVLDEEI
ncbi:hypothetical protein OA959_00150 [SAR86 cluster bacterium]|nr:hypothetical protein [SAR86 cluster bacterium]